ncbi:MAG: GntR family transcriptional regulator [Bacillota bacterium]
MISSWFHLNPRSGVPLYLQLKEQVKTAVAGGVLKPGDRLLPVREMADNLSVNPNTVARAYSELEREGLLSSEQGRGTFIRAAEPLLGEEERKIQVQGLMDKVLVEAFNLRLTPEELQLLWKQRLQAWETRLRGAKRGGW